MLRILIAGVLGGIAMYVWSAGAHMSPLGMMGVATIANEAAVTGPMKAELGGKPGLYMFPGAAMEGGKPPPGPSGLLIYEDEFRGMGVSTLGSELAVEVLEAVIAAFLLSLTALTGYWSRVGFVTLVGLAAVLSTNPSLAIWYGFPTAFTVANIVMDLAGYFVAGLVIAAILRRRAA